jgi:hypothetical protein
MLKRKLIKLDEIYYVIDDGDVNYGDTVLFKPSNKIEYSYENHLDKTYYARITHTILEMTIIGVTKIKKSVFENIVYGYNLDEIALKALQFDEMPNPRYNREDYYQVINFKYGFTEHRNLSKDKLFTLDDMVEFACDVYNENYQKDKSFKKCAEDMIKLKAPKTEWDIEIDENNNITLI